MPRPKNVLLWTAVWLLILLVAATLVIVVHPVLLTGQYYEVTVRTIFIAPSGRVTILFDDVISYRTEVMWDQEVTRDSRSGPIEYWDGKPPRFLRWPRSAWDNTFSFRLTSDEELARGVGDSPMLRQRLLIQEGTYQVRKDTPLQIFRRTDPDGFVAKGQIEIHEGIPR